MEEQLPAPSRRREERGCEYWFLTLIWGEESIPSAMGWWEEGRASLTTALGHGGDMACDNLQNRWKCFVFAERGGACSSLLWKAEKSKVQKTFSGWETQSSGRISLESHSSAYLMSYRSRRRGSLSLGVLKDAVCETPVCWVPACDRHHVGQPFFPPTLGSSLPTTALSLS